MMGQKAQIRCQMYAALARAFDEPGAVKDEAMLRACQEAFRELAISSLEGEIEEMEALIQASRMEPADVVRKRLDVECNRLFGGAGRPLAPPWGSFYRGSEEQRGLPIALNLIGVYTVEGLAMAQDYRGLPDHITPELEFMAHLCGKEARAWEEVRLDGALEYRLQERAFLEEHLSPWIPLFCRRVLSNTKEPFYLSLASITWRFLSWETASLGDLGVGGTPETEEPLCSWELEVAPDLCTFCEACIVGCPAEALKMERDLQEARLVFETDKCEGHHKCVELCPEGAITLKSATLGKEGEVGVKVVARSLLARCLGCGSPLEPVALLEKLSGTLGGSSFLKFCPQCRINQMVPQRTAKSSG